MSEFVKVSFSAFGQIVSGEPVGTLVVFAKPDADKKGVSLSADTVKLLGDDAVALIHKGASTAKFAAKKGSMMEFLEPHGLSAGRLVVMGMGETEKPEFDFVSFGGAIMGKLGSKAEAHLALDAGMGYTPAAAADVLLGIKLRAYRYEMHKTKSLDDADRNATATIVLGVADVDAAQGEAIAREALAQGVTMARTLVNEPANILYPAEFANRVRMLEQAGVEVEILDEKAMSALGMRALLGVGQGSAYESRSVIMRWNGTGKKDVQPIAFIGKGVCFDSGGISIKPAAGMEDMKGDMAGAACVVGLMHALASRKAKANVVAMIGLVENMPGGKAQRPGDIVKSMSGQTIEIINTDAEGRLVLADLLWHVQEAYKPAFMINLATLTGAILVALGQEKAGLFSNNDELSNRLAKAGESTGEAVWRMPLGKAYDKMIDSKFADMKNTGGRFAGSTTAAQFLQRFVNDTPWVHLDIAGTALGSPASDTNQSWGSGWGVRLLDRLVSEYYEG